MLFHHGLRRAKLHFSKHFLVLCATTSRNETERIRKFKLAEEMDIILENKKTLD